MGGSGFSSARCARSPPVCIGVRANLSIQAVPMVHSVPDFWYVLTEPEKPGALDPARALALGVPQGPLLGQLKRGQVVKLPDGTTVSPEQVIGSAVSGRTVAVLQDTCD